MMTSNKMGGLSYTGVEGTIGEEPGWGISYEKKSMWLMRVKNNFMVHNHH